MFRLCYLVVLFGLTFSTARAEQAEGLIGCFTRTYDSAHLARHPDQLVKAVKLRIFSESKNTHYELSFAIWIQRRGDPKALYSVGVCRPEATTLKCYVECDGGGVSLVTRSASTILMRLGVQAQDKRIQMAACGSKTDFQTSGTEVVAGKDDHIFLLNRVDVGICKGMESTTTTAPKTLHYGSRVGMNVTVISTQGLDSSQAVIHVTHTREDAEEFCKEYAGLTPNHSGWEACIRTELQTKLSDRVVANCTTGEFTTVLGTRRQFRGPNRRAINIDGTTPRYLIKDLDSNQLLGDYGASGYDVDLQTFGALCPKSVRPDKATN